MAYEITINHVMKLPEFVKIWAEQAAPALSHTIVEPQIVHPKKAKSEHKPIKNSFRANSIHGSLLKEAAAAVVRIAARIVFISMI